MSMRSIAITNQKGGAGKTTTAVNVAAALARAGQRVLLVDLDPQSHTSLHVGVQLSQDDAGIYDVLVRGLPPIQASRNISEHLVLIPAGIDLVGAELELHERGQREEVLAKALNTCHDAFDFCIIDCPPSLGLLTINALAAVDEVIIPLQPHFLALQGLGRLLETVTLVRGVLNPRLRVSGIVLCMFEKGTRLAQEVLEDIAQFVRDADPEDAWHGALVFQTKIRRNIKLAECPSFGQTVYDYAPNSHGTEDYLALSREIFAMSSSAALVEIAFPPVSQPVAEVVLMPESDLVAPIVTDPPSERQRPRPRMHTVNDGFCWSTNSHSTPAQTKQ